MRKRWVFPSLLLWCCAWAGSWVAAQAPDSVSESPNPRDISGFWGLEYDGRRVPAADLVPAVTQATLDEFAARDVHNIRWCNIVGVPAMMDLGRPLDIRQGPTTVVMVPEVANAAPRYVYLNRSTHVHEDYFDPASNGDSIGRWEGDVLIVDTTGFHESHGLMAIPGGGYRTPTAHLVERYRLVGDGAMLSVTFTWTDPNMFETPHSYEFRYWRYPDHYETVMPSGCAPWDPVRASFFEGPIGAASAPPASR